MPLEGEYEPSPQQWVREQVEKYESSGGTEGTTLLDTGLRVIIVTTRGKNSGKLRKNPVMRVEHNGQYALIASKGGAPKHPEWYFNIMANPDEVMIQDGPDRFDVTVHEATGQEREEWWKRAVEAFPDYEEYKKKTTRVIPVLVATRKN
jgi:deazaflavin-dependent oxidoreductase (nitroreductase family)